MKSSVEVCICYAHQDETLMRALERHLQVLEQQGMITLWHDRMIASGAYWQQEVSQHLSSAHIILLLVSANFLSSEQNQRETQQAMVRHHAGEALVILVILKPVMWKGTVFGQLKALPKDGKPITSSTWHSHDEALMDIVTGIEQAVEQFRRPTGPISAQSSTGAISHPLLKEQSILQQAPADVFLCHNAHDKPEVKKIGEVLKRRSIRPWLDSWDLQPGLPWQRALEAQIASIPSAAVFVGKGGIGPWQHMELEALLQEFVQRGCPVIPVLLASAPERPPLPLFLRNMVWVDFRRQKPDPINQLIWGIIRKKPGSDK
jgi:TIR domain